jgi:putative membrane protein
MFETLPLYLAFLGTAVALLAAALTIYLFITPYHEIRLIRQGNSAAAVSFGGTAIGMALVLYSTASSTFDVLELAIWGGLGLVGQVIVFLIVTLLLPDLKKGLDEDKLAYGILLGALSIAMGILNAGALST